jgi:dienelactone hydrolase
MQRGRGFRTKDIGLCALIVTSISNAANMQWRPEIYPIETVTMSLQEALIGGQNGKPATVAGVLQIPANPVGRIPAVILLHGGNGLSASEEKWVQEINGIGVATFLLDSFTGRGIRPTLDDREELATLTMLGDSYRALGVLAKDPRIDSGRIAVMGFSMGGAAALYASNERFRAMYAPAGVEFAAHIALYAPCYWHFRKDDRVTARPIRLFHGVDDDWSPIAPCRSYVQKLRETGADIKLTEYPGVHHGFDDIESPEPKFIPAAVSLRDCELVEDEGGVLLEGKTGKPFDIKNARCIRRGAHTGYNEAAAADTVRAVKEFLLSTFVLKRAG